MAPPSLRVLRQSVFRDCKSLKRVRLNDGLEVLGTDDHPGSNDWWGVFESSALEDVTLPLTLQRIEHSAFKGCTNLKSVTLPNGLEKIGALCFSGTSLEKLVLPGSVKEIGAGGF